MNDIFLRACQGRKTDYKPVWLMRQAGRYMPEYQKIRAKVDFLTLCKTPELATEVTLQPVDILNVDAAILFSDILVPLEPMGMQLEFTEHKGPVFHNPLRTDADVHALRAIDSQADVPYVLEAIRLLKQALKVPLIGFSGAPFTLATYMIEGGSSKNYIHTKRMMYQAPELFQSLMKLVSGVVTDYLLAQIRAGVDTVQIFDSWVGALSPHDFECFALPYVQEIIRALRASERQVPIIYFAFNSSSMMEQVRKAEADVYGLDWRIDIAKAVDLLDRNHVVQGNFDPCALFGTKETIYAEAKRILEGARYAPNHIFNLGHGILPETPVDNAKAMVEAVHEISLKAL
ncbi:MAG TPA: uroporphyrinogen decarboxylase [Dissulfurispiraceae bacterium]|nr:uroporphyrinogen decarboxylase [Dissulfurispiraceae bacterium]